MVMRLLYATSLVFDLQPELQRRLFADFGNATSLVFDLQPEPMRLGDDWRQNATSLVFDLQPELKPVIVSDRNMLLHLCLICNRNPMRFSLCSILCYFTCV